PTSHQPPVTVENKNAELRRDGRNAELDDCFAVEIRDDINIVARVSVDMTLRVGLLNVLCFGVEAMSDNGRDHPTQRRQNVLLEIHECNKPDFGIAQSYLSNAIPDSLGLRFIAAVDDRNDHDVVVGCGKLVAIDVGEDELISISRMQLHCVCAGDS